MAVSSGSPEIPRRVLMVAPEVAPMAKVGGLGDVVGALPKALHANGLDVRVICPLYRDIERQPHWKPSDRPLTVRLGGDALQCRVWEGNLPGSQVPVYFLEYDIFYGRAGIYDGPFGFNEDNDRRFAFLCRAALNLCYWLEWYPDVFHLHDWTTGLLPVMLNTTDANSRLADCATVMTIHNLQHQGYVNARVLDYTGIPWREFRPDSLESMGAVNLFKGGLYHSTKITTVSPTYAREITTPAFGCGLDGVLRFRGADLMGILNGIDTHEWDPATDRFLPAPFARPDDDGKAVCKEALQRAVGLHIDPTVPLFGVVARLFEQKGLDLLALMLPRILDTMHVQIVMLGTGDPHLEQTFREVSQQYPGRCAAQLSYNNSLAHLIYGGSDAFIMPSRFEPCGLGQMYAMRYGSLPVVRATGGLVDTVQQFDPATGEGTGFRFTDATPEALYETIGWATATWYDYPETYRAMQARAMSQDFSWETAALQYEQVYRWAVASRRGVTTA